MVKFHVDKGKKRISVDEYIKIIDIKFVFTRNLNLIKESIKFVARNYNYNILSDKFHIEN
jgi:hypothetical protein